MNPTFCFIAVLLANVSGYHIRGGRRILDPVRGEAGPLYGTLMSFSYEETPSASTAPAKPQKVTYPPVSIELPSVTHPPQSFTTGPTTAQEVAQAESPSQSLNGTSWAAADIGGLDRPPATLTFDSSESLMAGSTGCNNYRGRYEMLSDDSFQSPNEFSTTKMYCNVPGLMEWENYYVRFMKQRVFFYEIRNVQEGDVWKEELVLYEEATDAEGASVRGDVVARFVRIDDAESEPV